MDLERVGNQSFAARTYLELRDLGLLENIAELEALGLTVVLPERSQAAKLQSDLREAIGEVVFRRTGRLLEVDAETGDRWGPSRGEVLYYLLAESPAFQAAVLNPVVIALARFMLGEEPILSSCNAWIKGRGVAPVPLHADQKVEHSPRSLNCNVTYLLTDYGPGAGELCFVPGSHRLMRQPTSSENFQGVEGVGYSEMLARLSRGEDTAIVDPVGAISVVAPAGSVVAWHGNTWHGAYPRTLPGLRLSLVLYFAASTVRTNEAYAQLVPDAILEGSGELARIIGRDVVVGWGPEGPQFGAGKAFEYQRARTVDSRRGRDQLWEQNPSL